MEIVHLYHCDDKEKSWSEESNKQFTGLEFLQADIILSGREGKRSAVRNLGDHRNSQVKILY